MAYTKSRYKVKRYRDGGAVDTAPETSISIDTNAPVQDVADEASVAFQKQIDALRAAEQRKQPMAAPPQSHDDILKQWKRGGLSDIQENFLRANPEMIDNPGILEAANNYAHLAGHEANTDAHFDAVKSYWHKHMTLPAAVADTSEAEDRPRKSKSRDDDDEPSRSSNRSLYSAPVSREAPGMGYNSDGERPGTVRLTAAMKEHARAAGISEAEYARGVLRLREEKKDGLHQ